MVSNRVDGGGMYLEAGTLYGAGGRYFRNPQVLCYFIHFIQIIPMGRTIFVMYGNLCLESSILLNYVKGWAGCEGMESSFV